MCSKLSEHFPKILKNEMYFSICCVFCTINCYFEYRIRILCIFLYMGTYFKCILDICPSSSTSCPVVVVICPSVRPVVRPVVVVRPLSVRPVVRPVVRRRRPSSVVVVRRRPSKYYLQDVAEASLALTYSITYIIHKIIYNIICKMQSWRSLDSQCIDLISI